MVLLKLKYWLGIRQLDEVSKAIKIYPEYKYLILILKCILSQRDLNETY